MALPPDREQFIPIRPADLLELLCRDRGPSHDNPLSEEDQAAFRRFADTASAHIHARYLDQLKRLKANYAAFDPDSVLKLFQRPTDVERAGQLDDLFEQFAALLQQANYKRLTRAELERIMLGASEWGVDMHVPWAAYEKVDVYVRGLGPGRRTRRKWYRLFRTEQVTVPTFSRVVLILKQRPHKALGEGADTQHVFLKLFKDIPTMDLEMLLPGTRIKMPLLDRLRLGGSGLGSLGWVAYKLNAMTAPLLKALGLITTGAVFGEEGLVGLIALYTPLALILGYAYKTYASFSTTKQAYMLQLSQSLYYQNLDNNAGVMYRLLGAAEDQEVREMLLAYFFLWRYAQDRGWVEEELDQYIELELARHLGTEVDFEIADAVRKLEQAGVVTRSGGRLRAVPVQEAFQRVREVGEKVAPGSPPTPASGHPTVPAGAV
jgi:hypothetical protein